MRQSQHGMNRSPILQLMKKTTWICPLKALRVCILIAFPATFSPYLAAQAEHAPPKKADKQENPLVDDACFGRLPSSYDQILKKIQEVRELVAQGSLSPTQAQQLVSAAGAAQGFTQENMGAVYAVDALSQMQSSNDTYFSLLGKLAGGTALSADDKSRLLSYLRAVDPAIKASDLPQIQARLSASTHSLRSRGAVFSDNGIDLSKVDLSKIDTDTVLRKDLSTFFPDLDAQLEARKSSRAPQKIVIGTQILLPHGRVLSQEKYAQEVEGWLDTFNESLVSYSTSSRQASTYADWIKGRLRPEKQDDGTWAVRTDQMTAAEIERDGSYKQLMKSLEIMKTKYALEPELQKELLSAISETVKEESKVIDKNIKATHNVLWAVRANGAFSVFAILTRVPRTMAIAWAAVSVAAAANTGASAALAHRNFGGDFFCHLSDKMADNAGIFALAPAAAIAAPALAPSTLASAASLARVPLSAGQITSAYGAGLKVAGIAGIGSGSFKAIGAIGSHRQALLHDSRGEANAAAEQRMKRDQALLDAGFELPMGFMAFKAGRVLQASAKAVEGVSPAQKLQTLMNKKVTEANDAKALMTDLDELLVARATLESNPASVAAFRRWIQANPIEVADYLQVRKTLKGHNTLDDLLARLAIKYSESVGAAQGAAWKSEFSWAYAPRTILTDVSHSAGAAVKKVGGMVLQGATLGAIMSVSNAGLEQNIAPAQDLARAVTAVTLGTLAATERDLVIKANTSLKKLQEADDEIKRAKEAGQMDNAAWTSFQNRFSQVYGDFVNSLPPQLRDGRSIFFDFEGWGPINTGDILATRNFEYLFHKDIVDTLQQKQASGSALSSAEQTKLSSSLQQTNVILEQMAGVIAMYQVRNFIYGKDLAKPKTPQEIAADRGVERIMHNIKNSMGIESYTPLIMDRLQRIITDYQSEIIGDLQKQLETQTGRSTTR